jgi:hypothetical protein
MLHSYTWTSARIYASSGKNWSWGKSIPYHLTIAAAAVLPATGSSGEWETVLNITLPCGPGGLATTLQSRH